MPTNQPYDRNQFLGDEITHTQHDAERMSYLLQALESFQNEPHLKEEIKELVEKVHSMEEILQHTIKADTVERNMAVKEAVTHTHQEDEQILKKTVEQAHIDDQLLLTKAAGSARKQGYAAGTHDEKIEEQIRLHEAQETLHHLLALIDQAPKSLMGNFIKVKKDELLKLLSELKGIVDSFAPASAAETVKVLESVQQNNSPVLQGKEETT